MVLAPTGTVRPAVARNLSLPTGASLTQREARQRREVEAQASEPWVSRYASFGGTAPSHFESYADATVKSSALRHTAAGLTLPVHGPTLIPGDRPQLR
jgi:hypothetical protein